MGYLQLMYIRVLSMMVLSLAANVDHLPVATGLLLVPVAVTVAYNRAVVVDISTLR